MIIVDGQIHLWEKGTPSAHHRQEPYLAEQAIADMDEAGVDRALVHPVLWDPDSNEVAQAAKFAQSALNVGLSRTEIIETVIQTGPYSGLAPALNALAALSQAIR